MPFMSNKLKNEQQNKRKPPPRPPPPNFSRYKSKSTLNINQQVTNLIEWSPPSSPKVERSHNFGGSVSSSFSSSTSSLASSKKSFECDISNNVFPISFNSKTNFVQPSNSTFFVSSTNLPAVQTNNPGKVQVPSVFGPTIIRAQAKHETRTKTFKETLPSPNPPSPPMPSIPPPSPPKEAGNIDVAYGIALFDYQGTEPGDLQFQVNDVILLLRRLNKDWYYGRVLEKEGMFPANFIEVKVPLMESDQDNTVMALYEFTPQMSGDLALKPGQLIRVMGKIDNDWLYGESGGVTGQFPSNFVDRIPKL